jgi:uncharacterized membrane protein
MTAASQGSTPSAALGGAFRWAGYLIGLAMGGFLDGILFHQVLQWHHLLSLVEGSMFRDIRVQIFADGMFHVLMYVIALAGLYLLWRGRRDSAADGADRALLAAFLIGFGGWHIIDAVLFHWILGIHHVRVRSDNPILWDLALFAVGLVFAAWGWRVGRGTSSGGMGGRRRVVAPVLLVVAPLVVGPIAALPPPNVSGVTVLFRPGTSVSEVFAGLTAADARIVGADRSGQVWIVKVAPGGNALAFYRHGALLVGGALFPAGCVSSAAI